jgi:stage V sporulation protein AC
MPVNRRRYMKKEAYKKYIRAVEPRSPLLKNCLFAYLSGGIICCLGQGLIDLYEKVLGMPKEDAGTLCAITLIFIAVFLTGVGVFDNIARRVGAGTLVPITGFANSVASPAIDSRAEGLVLGVGAKIFTVAGPVLLYGTLAGGIYGAVYWIYSMIFA